MQKRALCDMVSTIFLKTWNFSLYKCCIQQSTGFVQIVLFLLWEECYYNYHLTHLLVYLISVVQWAFVIFSVLIMVFCSLTKSENRAVSPYRFSFIRSGSLVKKSTAMNSSTAKRRVST